MADPTHDHKGMLTEYVATRWYRAPEIMLNPKAYFKASECGLNPILGSSRDSHYLHLQLMCGLLVAYLLSSSPINQSSLANTVRENYSRHSRTNVVIMCFVNNSTDLDQVHIILNVIGSPSQEDLTSVTSEQVPCTQCPLMSLYVFPMCLGTSLLAESPTTTSSTLVTAILPS